MLMMLPRPSRGCWYPATPTGEAFTMGKLRSERASINRRMHEPEPDGTHKRRHTGRVRLVGVPKGRAPRIRKGGPYR